MSKSSNLGWADILRKYIYVLLAIFFSVIVIAVGFRSWQNSNHNAIQNQANNYHLSSEIVYLAAMAELREMHLFIVKNQRLTGDSVSFSPAFLRSCAVMVYLADEKIQHGIRIHKFFHAPEVEVTTAALQDLFNQHQKITRSFVSGEVSAAPLLNNITKLNKKLEQLIRLHRAVKSQLFADLSVSDKKWNNVFYLLLGILFGLGLLAIQICFKAINSVIKEQQEAHEKIAYQAKFDGLTDLPNRSLCLDRLQQMKIEANRNEKKVAVIFLDLDNFKKVNDTLGHNVGDQVLIETACRLKNSVRDGDTVGRLSGDEFILLLGGLKRSEDVQPIVKKILKQNRDPIKLENRDVMLTMSVGICLYPEDGKKSIELLRKADVAMYKAKANGGNNFAFYTRAMNTQAQRQLLLEEKLLEALNNKEFQVFYQPQVCLSTNEIVGAEALLRWHSSSLGWVSPDEFIPIAEQTGLIMPLGQYVLKQALMVAGQWLKTCNPSMRIAVNISPKQLFDPHLVDFVSKTLHENNIPSAQLELEITEGVLLKDHQEVNQVLESINKLGVRLALDDFGTGYSSLSYLRRFPFHVVKIDRSFVSDLSPSSANRELVCAAISMSHGLKLKVLAEGVETLEQLNFLRQNNCDYAQGYYFGKPTPAKELEKLLLTKQWGFQPLTAQQQMHHRPH